MTLADVRAAAARLAGRAHRTPVVTCATLDRLAGRRLFLKCEQFQKGGAFKFRGAWSALSRLAPEVAARGVVTHSSGNHAQALALAARLAGVPAHVVMPANAAAPKLAAVRGYGAEVVLCAPTEAAREAAARELLERTGGTFIPPFDHPDVVAGQGTVALELLEQVPGLDAIVAPVGGGGLLSGIAVAAHGLRPSLAVLAGEPAGADDAARSLAAGRRILQTAPATLADGLLTSLSELTFALIQEHVEQILTVGDEEIVAAMRLLWERAKLVVEPSGAVALAAVLGPGRRALEGRERVGVVLSGGNVDLERLPWAPRG